MASSASLVGGRTPGAVFRLAMIATGLLVILPVSGRAQDVDRRAYRSAQSAYNHALNERDLADARYSQAHDEVSEARDSGDQARHGRALAVFQSRAEEVELSNQLLVEAGAALEQTRRAYLASVEQRLERLLFDELPLLAEGSREHNLMTREITNLNNEADLLVTPVEIDDDPFAEITSDPGDSPSVIRAKADLLDRRAALHERSILDVDAQIESYEKRLRHARMSQDFGADLFRFDDLRVPVGTPDAASANAVGLTGNEELSQRLEALYRFRELLIDRRDIARVRAREFRQRIGGELV